MLILTELCKRTNLLLTYELNVISTRFITSKCHLFPSHPSSGRSSHRGEALQNPTIKRKINFQLNIEYLDQTDLTSSPPFSNISLAINREGFNPAPSVPGATLFTGSLEVCPSGVGTSHFVIRAAPQFFECHFHNNKQAA